MISHDLPVANFLPHLYWSLAVDRAAKRLAILHLEGCDQKHGQETQQKLSVHFDLFLQLILQRFTEVTYWETYDKVSFIDWSCPWAVLKCQPIKIELLASISPKYKFNVNSSTKC